MIYLRSGDHGDVTLTGVNEKFITIEAEAGHTPVIRHLTTSVASKWIIRGITFRDEGADGWLVLFTTHGWRGPSDNIIFERNTLLSNSNVQSWTAEDWRNRGKSGVKSDATCATIKKNHITNIRRGIMIVGSNNVVDGNIIDHFADDGINVIASNVSITGNRITNNHEIGDGNHNDGIQGWTARGQVNENVLIADNVVINSTDPGLLLPGGMQGITIFDGKWQNLRVLRNRVITNVWHGITVSGVTDSVVEGNTVVGSDPKRISWIAIGNMKKDQGGDPPRNVIVRNNVAPKIIFPHDTSAVISSGNRCYQSGNYSDTTREC